jgi:hypothetical protein
MKKQQLTFVPNHSTGIYLAALSFALLAAGVAVAVFIRSVGVDTAALILQAQEYIARRSLYDQILDPHPPTNSLVHAFPILMHTWFDFDTIRSWNAYLIFLSILSAAIFASAVPFRHKLAFGGLWAAAFLLMYDDFNTGQREYLFILFWIPYLANRIRLGDSDNRLAQAASGFLAGIVICAKPYFAVFAAASELILIPLARNQTRWIPLLLIIVSGAVQVAIFFIFYSVGLFLENLRQIDYYNTVGTKYEETITVLAGSIVFQTSVLYFVGYFLLFVGHHCGSRTFHVLCFVTVIIGVGLGIFQGSPRLYYLIPGTMATIASALVLSNTISTMTHFHLSPSAPSSEVPS